MSRSTTSLIKLPFGASSEETVARIRASRQAHAAEQVAYAYETRYHELQAQFEAKLAELRAEYLAQLAAIACGDEAE